MSYPTDEEIGAIIGLEDDEDRIRLVKKLILQTRIEEADGFDHGNEAWSGNMDDEEIQSDSPIYNYQQRLEKEQREL